jgi:chloramphenicol-sensitive protein RarD
MADRRGYLFGIGAYLLWGLFPLYWHLVRGPGAIEVLAHRIVWSMLFVTVVATITRRWRSIGTLVRRPRTVGLMVLAAVLIAVNWGTYIYGVQSERVVETSLGYFINPLVTVLIGVVVLRERLRPWQWVAMGAGAVAVTELTIGYGRVPYLALILATTFACYGLVKKRVAVPALDGLVLESSALALPAMAVVVGVQLDGTGALGHAPTTTIVLLVASGAVTAVPLLLFAGAANRVPLSGIGLLQYLAPILQLACGVLVLGEPMPAPRLAGFGLVWLALCIFTIDAIRHARRSAQDVPMANPVAFDTSHARQPSILADGLPESVAR